jgi:uncharacterized protein YndB with AHSA1/START domain
MEELPQIERSIQVPAPPEDVWERIVDGRWAEEWMGVEIEPRRGGRVTVPDREVIGTVEEVVPGESITWSWREIESDPSQVTIEITRDGEGTEVKVTERLLEYRITGMPPTFSMAA